MLSDVDVRRVINVMNRQKPHRRPASTHSLHRPFRERAALIQPTTAAKIPSSNVRRPANIPLHTLSSSSRPYDTDRSSFHDGSAEKRRGRRSSISSESTGSDFSLWSDTGDLVDQLADDEDPLRIRLRQSLEEQQIGGSTKQRGRSSKRVRYRSQEGASEKRSHPQTGVVRRKEDIRIPSPPPRKISRAENILAAVMSGDRPSRMHGLHGKKLLYFTSVFVSLGVFLFGYDQGVMSGIITGPYFKDYFNQPTRAEIGTMVAILEVGAFMSSLSVGRIGDLIGRRRTILYGAMVFLVGGALQTFANGMPMMLLGRIVAGLGVGALSTIVPVYQSEISPPHNRGKLACIEFTGNVSGYAASVWVDYFCSYINSDWAWRIPLLMQCVMGALLGLGSLLICESPRWLLDNDHDEEGIVVIANLYGKGDIHNAKARDEYREIKMNVLLQRQEGERSYGDMFRRYYKRVFIAMSAQALAQLNGINVISYYAPLVFEQAGWVGRDAILMTGINGITYLLSTVPPWYLVDRWGRRLILLSGAVAMIISLSAISYFIFIDIRYTPTLVVIFVMIYNASFGASWGPIPWLYPPEILPLSIRAKGASLSTAANWAFNWLVGEMTPILQEWIKWRLYLLHAFFCAVSFVVVYFIYPETANVRLEDMNALFGDATTAMPTPATLAEAESLFGDRSPVPSFHLAGQGADSAIPGLDINPPTVSIEDGKPMLSKDQEADSGEGLGGWISNLVKRSKGHAEGEAGSGRYRRVEQDDE
ncbi:MFS monosaccharide transporter-like protein [Cryomyces antarcticus]